MRLRILWAVACAVVLAACSRDGGESGAAHFAERPAAMMAPPPKTMDVVVSQPRRTLAYEHAIRMDAAEAEVRPIHDKLQADCQRAADHSCTVLSSRVTSGRNLSAELRVRASPATVRALMAGLQSGGRVTEVSTTAEDLAAPIFDAERNKAKLLAYRDKLESLGQRADKDVEALIKLHRELAEVQSQIESNAGDLAKLRERVDLEILEVNIDSVQQAGFGRPISAAAADFGTSLSNGIAVAITACAYLLPWLILLAAIVLLVRRWRRRRRAKASS